MGNGASPNVRARSKVWSFEESSIIRICVSKAASERGIREITFSILRSALYATMNIRTFFFRIGVITNGCPFRPRCLAHSLALRYEATAQRSAIRTRPFRAGTAASEHAGENLRAFHTADASTSRRKPRDAGVGRWQRTRRRRTAVRLACRSSGRSDWHRPRAGSYRDSPATRTGRGRRERYFLAWRSHGDGARGPVRCGRREARSDASARSGGYAAEARAIVASRGHHCLSRTRYIGWARSVPPSPAFEQCLQWI